MSNRLRGLIDGLESVQVALLNEAGAAVNYKLDFVQFTPAEAEELAAFVIKAADFLRRVEEILGAGLGADAPVHCRDRVAEAPDHDDECPFGAP